MQRPWRGKCTGLANLIQDALNQTISPGEAIVRMAEVPRWPHWPYGTETVASGLPVRYDASDRVAGKVLQRSPAAHAGPILVRIYHMRWWEECR